MDSFEKRINYSSDIKPFLISVCQDYRIGEYINHKIVPIGYEDLNLVLQTSNDKYFVKIFADFRSDNDCLEYVNKISENIKAGVSHPKIIPSSQGNLYTSNFDGYKFRLTIMEYIDGVDFFEGKLSPNEDEKRFLVQQAAIINSINLKPTFIYDSWAIVNFLKEYEKSKNYLDNEALEKIEPLAKEFESLAIEELPHCFVHGDLIKTNVMKDKNDKLYIIDFAVSNYYPRIVELAVLLCNMLFDKKPEIQKENYRLALDEYQKKIKLIELELKTLPLFNKIAHAMHVIRGTYEREVNKNLSQENSYWINLGRTGLGLDGKAI